MVAPGLLLALAETTSAEQVHLFRCLAAMSLHEQATLARIMEPLVVELEERATAEQP